MSNDIYLPTETVEVPLMALGSEKAWAFTIQKLSDMNRHPVVPVITWLFVLRSQAIWLQIYSSKFVYVEQYTAMCVCVVLSSLPRFRLYFTPLFEKEKYTKRETPTVVDPNNRQWVNPLESSFDLHASRNKSTWMDRRQDRYHCALFRFRKRKHSRQAFPLLCFVCPHDVIETGLERREARCGFLYRHCNQWHR